jgi:type IV pilus assembly protein PilF
MSLGMRLRRSLWFTLLLAGAFEMGCGPKVAGDPVAMSTSEYDLAVDLWTRQRQPREALLHALRAAELDDSSAEAAHLVSLIYLEFCQSSTIGECRLDEAETYARRGMAADPKSLEIQNTLAVILVHGHKFDEAIALLEPITQNILYPTPEIAWGNLGWAYLEKGDLPRAVTALSRAVAAQPLFCVGNYRLGLAYRRLGQLASARDALDRALNAHAAGCSNLQDAYLVRAEVAIALGEGERGRADLDRCIALDKSNRTGLKCTEMLNQL